MLHIWSFLSNIKRGGPGSDGFRRFPNPTPLARALQTTHPFVGSKKGCWAVTLLLLLLVYKGGILIFRGSVESQQSYAIGVRRLFQEIGIWQKRSGNVVVT